MRRASTIVALIVSASLAGCEYPLFPDRDDVFLRTDESQYAAGDTATLRLTNDSGETIGYNLCMHLIQRHDDDGRWTDTLYGHDLPCIGIWLELRHGDVDTHPAPLDPGMPPGTYRFRTRVDADSEGEFRIYSRPFDVE